MINRDTQAKEHYLNFIRRSVLNAYCTEYKAFKSQSETLVFYKALKVLPVTKKALCKAFDLNIDSMCRRKRMFEIDGKLQQSRKRIVCPYTGKYAHLLTTDRNLFNSKIFGNE